MAKADADSLDAAADTILRWRRIGPMEWAREMLGFAPTDQQARAGRRLAQDRKLTIRSGHGTGKSAFEAIAVLWFLCSFFPCKIPCTAPTGHQLSDILWAEIAKWLRVLEDRNPSMRGQIEWTSTHVCLRDAPEEAFAVARTARPDVPEALQGFHSENLLLVIDEASGVPDKVFEVGEGTLSTENVYVVMVANPTRMQGYFYDSHNKDRAAWACEWWNGEDSPNVSREYVANMAAKYGAESSIYRIRVRGEFAGNPDGVISLDLIERACERDVKPYGAHYWGVDVARFGDDASALAKRCDNTLLEPVIEWYKQDTMVTAGIVKQHYDAAKVKPTKIYVDVIGIGAGVADRLRELGLPVVGINVAESPAMKDQYERLRDELWFRGREWFESLAVAFPRDEDTIGELTLPTFRTTSTGKIKVESKDELKKRGVKSPNRADAFLLTFGYGGFGPGARAGASFTGGLRLPPLKLPKLGIR